MRGNRQAQGRLHGLEPVAVVDIGSNSVRLLVYEGAVRSPAPLFNEKVLCGLGRKLATTGRLGKTAMERALMALGRFRRLADQIGARSLHAVATAAARDAENGPSFIAEAEKIFGAPIRVLSGREEAELAAAGILAGFVNPDGVAGDLGGGSLELIEVDGDGCKNAATLPLGGLRLMDASGGDLNRAIAYIDEKLAGVEWLERRKGRAFYAIGGTLRALARLHMIERHYPLSVVHGYRMSGEDIAHFTDALTQRPLASFRGLDTIPSERRETLPYGALVLKRVIQKMRPSETLISAFGVREGLLYNLLPARERARDPLMAACEELACLRSRSPEHARELCGWTDALYLRPGPRESEEERRLRHAACLLSDIAWRAHHDYRGEQSLSLVAQANFAGIDHAERAFLALTVYYRHESGLKGDFSPQLRKLVGRRWHKRAQLIGEAVQTAHALSGGVPGIITQTPLTWENGKIVLQLPAQLAALDGERLRRRLKALANLLNSEPEIRIGAQFEESREAVRALARHAREEVSK